MKYNSILLLVVVLLLPTFKLTAQDNLEAIRQQVKETEKAFAKTMADRNFTNFGTFLSAEAVFFSGQQPLHGKKSVEQWWKKFFETPQAPFSWEPDKVEVLDSGTLAISTGPVRDEKGKIVSRFTSIWRLEAPNTWRIIFDKGEKICDTP